MCDAELTPALSPEETAEQQRRADQLDRLKGKYLRLMAEAKAELDRAMEEGQIVRVAGFIRSCKGRKKKP